MLEYYRFKLVLDLFSKGHDEEARLQLSELQRRYVAICSENTTYKAQIEEYEDILYLARNLFFDGKLFWLITGSIKQGPFCPTCYNYDGLLMRLAGEGSGRHCPACRTLFWQEEEQSTPLAAAVPQERVPELAQPRVRTKIIPFRRRS